MQLYRAISGQEGGQHGPAIKYRPRSSELLVYSSEILGGILGPGRAQPAAWATEARSDCLTNWYLL